MNGLSQTVLATASHGSPMATSAVAPAAVVVGTVVGAILIWKYVSRTAMLAILAMVITAMTPAFGGATNKARAMAAAAAGGVVVLLSLAWSASRRSARRAQAQAASAQRQPGYYPPAPAAAGAGRRSRRGR